MNTKYKCIFFDLDHTLWDYETNSKEALLELYHQYDLLTKGVHVFEDFFQEFRRVNLTLWDAYDRGHITSDVIRGERFKQILAAFKVYEQKLCEDISHDYLYSCPQKCNLMPEAVETLDYLKRHYNLTVITNGFEEIQHQKLRAGKLTDYFTHIITSQKAGHRKPARQIFEYALNVNKIDASKAIMVGDNPITDIGGARNAAIDAVLFNPESIDHAVEAHYEIKGLKELQHFL